MISIANGVVDYYTSRTENGTYYPNIRIAGISLSEIPPIQSIKAYNVILRQAALFIPSQQAFGGNLWSAEEVESAGKDKSYIERYRAYFGETVYPENLFSPSGIPTQVLFAKILTRAKELGDISSQVYVRGSEINAQTLYIDAAALTFENGYAMVKLFDDAEHIQRGNWGLTAAEIASGNDYVFEPISYAYFDSGLFEVIYKSNAETIRVSFKWEQGQATKYALQRINVN